MSALKLIILLGALGAMPGCADSIDNDPEMPPDPPPSGKVQTTRGGDATYTTLVDSTSMTDWTYADFETGGELPATGSWDLRFQRFHISTNGGASGTGGVEVAPIVGSTFAAVTAAPASGFVSDGADGNGDGMPDYALERGDGWYGYDDGTHLLTPRPIVWVVKTAGGAMLKLEILDYYDDAGTSGWFTLHWAPL
jgi:hypothetical protein